MMCPARDTHAGFSLLELLVASTCSALIAAAVFSLMVGSAQTARREWGAVAARRVAAAAVARVADDLSRAHFGLEAVDSVQVGGARIGYASAAAGSLLRVVVATGRAAEVLALGPGAAYTVAATEVLHPGDSVVAVGLPGRPPSAPLPLGSVAAITPYGGHNEVLVAWRPAEAAAVAAWGPPRALLPVSLRDYDLRSFDGALQLGRRTDSGARQPVADGLEALRIEWIVDSDFDGHADAVRQGFVPGSGGRACAARVQAVARVATRAPAAPAAAPRTDRALESAVRWVTLGPCR